MTYLIKGNHDDDSIMAALIISCNVSVIIGKNNVIMAAIAACNDPAGHEP